MTLLVITILTGLLAENCYTIYMIDPQKFGVSFSVKQCAKFGQNPDTTLRWLLDDMGFRRVRLMSYWDEIERRQGVFDFTSLDQQVQRVVDADGVITMSIGVKQPRYPEYHWPKWAWELPKAYRDTALLTFIEAVVKHYEGNPRILTWHLENEALLRGFGENIEIDRKRLRAEYALVKKLDPLRPVILSTSAAWGIPVIGPIPDISAFSYYLTRWKKTKYTTTYHYAWIHRWRAFLIKLIWRKQSFIHELQMEPWGPREIWEMEPAQQDESMGPAQIAKNFKNGKSTKLYPIDLWGGEWWYQRAMKYDDNSVAEQVKSLCK